MFGNFVSTVTPTDVSSFIIIVKRINLKQSVTMSTLGSLLSIEANKRKGSQNWK